jgi:hypothetical protein
LGIERRREKRAARRGGPPFDGLTALNRFARFV